MGLCPHPTWESTLAKELTVAIPIKQSSLNELSTSVSDSAKCKQMKVNRYTLTSQADAELQAGLGVRYQPEVKLGRFQSWLEVSCISSHTDETVCLHIYIYIISGDSGSTKLGSYFQYNLQYVLVWYINLCSLVRWGCRICRIHLCREIRPPPNESLWYDTKPSNGEASILVLGECGVPARVPSMDQIEQFNHLTMCC